MHTTDMYYMTAPYSPLRHWVLVLVLFGSLVKATQRAVFCVAPFFASRQIIALQPQAGKARLCFFMMEEPTVNTRRKAPPCGNLRCTSPERNVRLQFIPPGWVGDKRAGAVCFHRGKADCRRYFLGGEPGK